MIIVFLPNFVVTNATTTTPNNFPVQTSTMGSLCSNSFGTLGTSYFWFNVTLTDLKSLFVYFDQNHIYAIEFDYIQSGNRFNYGNYDSIPNINVLNIEIANKTINGIKIESGILINGLQFEVHDLLTNTTEWTPLMGAYTGNLSLTVNSTDFQIINFTQYIDLNGYTSIHSIPKNATYSPFLRRLDFNYYNTSTCYQSEIILSPVNLILGFPILTIGISICIPVMLILFGLIFFKLYKYKYLYLKSKNFFIHLYFRNTNLCKKKTGKDFQIFLSYSHKDKNKADIIFHELTDTNNFNVWMDRFQINIGDDWAERIHTGVKASEHLVALISNNYLESENCCNEFKLGIHFKKKLFIILIENINEKIMKSVLEIDSNVVKFDIFKAQNLRRSKELKNLVDTLKQTMSTPRKTSILDQFS